MRSANAVIVIIAIQFDFNVIICNAWNPKRAVADKYNHRVLDCVPLFPAHCRIAKLNQIKSKRDRLQLTAFPTGAERKRDRKRNS